MLSLDGPAQSASPLCVKLLFGRKMCHIGGLERVHALGWPVNVGSLAGAHCRFIRFLSFVVLFLHVLANKLIVFLSDYLRLGNQVGLRS